MTKRLLSLLIAVAMGMVIMFFAHQNNALPDWVPNKSKEQLDSLKRKTEDKIDSLTARVKFLEMKRYLDSLSRMERLNANNREIQRLRNNAKQVSFKEYTDPMLDSVISTLYPKPR